MKTDIFYYLKEWFILMTYRTINIVSHTSLEKPKIFSKLFILLVIFFIFMTVIEIIKNRNKYVLGLAFISFFYALFIFYFVNYRTYLVTNSFSDGVQGRYLFPVISFYVLAFYSIYNLLKKKVIVYLFFFVTVCFMVYSDVFYFLKKYDRWFFPVPGISYDKGNIGELKIGQKTPKQKFVYNNKYDGIGIYASTYSRSVNQGIRVLIYDTTGKLILNQTEVPFVNDNRYLVVRFDKDKLKTLKEYYFEVENVSSTNPITLWYSAVDLPGNIENSDMDLVYALLDKETVNKFISRKF